MPASIHPHGTIEERGVLLRLLQETADLLGARWDKVPDRRRPHDAPEQRFRILRIKLLLALSHEETAHLFRVSPETIGNWERELAAHPEKETVSGAVSPVPPARRYADVVHHLVQAMGLLGFGGNRTIAAVLARAGWRIDKETVRRYRKEAPRTAPCDPRQQARALRPRFAHLVWFLDLTEVPGLFGRVRFRIATIFDRFSRMPVAAQVFDLEPNSDEIARLFERARRVHGKPRHVVTDKGGQFTGALPTHLSSRIRRSRRSHMDQ